MAQLTDAEILDMAGVLRSLQNPDECCHGLHNARMWLVEHRGHVDPHLIGWLKMQHVACDCEVIHHLARTVRQKHEPAFE